MVSVIFRVSKTAAGRYAAEQLGWDIHNHFFVFDVLLVTHQFHVLPGYLPETSREKLSD